MTEKWKWALPDEHNGGRADAGWAETGGLVDAKGDLVLTTVGCENAEVTVRDDAARLIQAAPELLEEIKGALKSLACWDLDDDGRARIEVLIKRIEGEL